MEFYTNDFIEILKGQEPSKIILQEGNQTITAKELLLSSYELAYQLNQKGVNTGDRTIIAVKPGIEFLRIMYANMFLRTVVSIIDPEMGRDNYIAKLRQFEPQVAFVDSRLVLLNEHPVLKYIVLKLNHLIPDFPRIKNCMLITTGLNLPIFQKHFHLKKTALRITELPDLITGNSNDDFLITYTSGTLAEPKGVVHSYNSLNNSIKLLCELLIKNKDESIATHLPHFALLGINAGVSVYLWSNGLNAKDKIEFIIKNNISTLFGPPSDFLPLIKYAEISKIELPNCIQNIYLGSAPVYSSFLKRLITVAEKINIVCLYGMTENLMVCFQDGRLKAEENIEGDLVGTPFSGVSVSLTSEMEVGIQSNQMFNRYWKSASAGEIHLTGDLGRIDENGRLILIGRKKDMIIRGNFNIYPGLYEPTINKIEGVIESAMIGIYNEIKHDEDVILVIESEKLQNEAEIIIQLRSGQFSIDKEAIPDRIIFMKLPRFGRQDKVNKKLLIEHLKNQIL